MLEFARHVRTVVLFLLVVAGMLGSSAFSAEPPFPGIYRGTYHIDRWGIHSLRRTSIHVSPHLEKQLKPFLGIPVEIDVLRMGPGAGSPALAIKLGSIRKLPMPVRLRIEWDLSLKTKSPQINQVKSGQGVKLKLTMTNQSSASLGLNMGRLGLALFSPRPSGAGPRRPLDYCSGRRNRTINMLGTDQTLDFGQRPPVSRPASDRTESLREGDSRAWILTLPRLSGNEFEVYAFYVHYQKDQRKHVHIHSNVLRFDVLTDKSQSWQGLEVSLEPDADRKPSQAGSVPMRIRFKNTDDQPLRFGLWKAGAVWDVSKDVLVCYDARGTLLPLPKPKAKQRSQTLRLEKGKDLTIPVDIPGDTKVARVVFHHRFDVTRFAKPDERVLEGDIYVFSRHMLLDPKNR